jgi:hypothetical protein
MHSLFLRIFVLFWIAMALIVGGSIAVTFTVAAREYESRELQHRPAAIAIQASEVIGKGGIAALKKWLSDHEHSIADRELYIIGPDGRDILGRRLSENASRRLEYFNRESMSEPESQASPPASEATPPPRNFRPQRAAPQIVGSDGSIYLRRPEPSRNLSDDPVHRAGGERVRELVAGPAPERTHTPHSRGRPGARQRKSRRARRQGSARQRGIRGSQG